MFENAKYCAIHPAIGIARVGNSPQASFVGPEVPGRPAVPRGGYKDSGDISQGVPPRVRRQGARFRIYAYDENHNLLGEVTAADAQITWTVHLANTKAAEESRNRTIKDRGSLSIDPGPRSLSGPDQRGSFDGGKFRNIEVPLGDLTTDKHGRLTVLGGFGIARTSNLHSRITNYRNNDYWYDDVSDGPVSARVTLKDDGREVEVKPSWVIVAPPDFAPAVVSIITLYDVALDVAIRKYGLVSHLQAPSFTRDIYPIFDRLSGLQWVQQPNAEGNGDGLATDLKKIDLLKSNSLEHRGCRARIFNRIRNPHLDPADDRAIEQATEEYVPALSGDGGDARRGKPATWLKLTRTQYDALEKWRDGDFEADWKGETGQSKDITPDGLDRAALEACTGGAFHPGMEASKSLQDAALYAEPFRLSHENLKAGDLTKGLACPWQADFFECSLNWWPTHRPDDVVAYEKYREVKDLDNRLDDLDPSSAEYQTLKEEREDAFQNRRKPWARGLPERVPEGDMAMAECWPQHGFVVDRTEEGAVFELGGASQFVETERGKYDGLDWPDYFHILTNIEQHPDFIPKAKELAYSFFAKANYNDHKNYARFTYSPEAFDRRMRKIYKDLEKGMDEPSMWDSGIIRYPVVVRREGDEEKTKDKAFDVKPKGARFGFSDRAIVERLRQNAPFNLVDGAWLQRIQPAGPGEEYKAHLFAIWDDEAGNGRVEQNHANVYVALLRSLNIVMPSITDEKFIKQDLLPSAYIQAVFQLCVSLFPEEFLPEILGMTLYLEWEATPTLTPVVRHLKRRRIDPDFFELHVAIDNIDAGHGALAKEAITLYLRKKEDEGVDVQSVWERIWRGYVTWATAGNLGQDLLERCLIMDHKQIDLSYPMMIEPKTITDPKGLVEKLKSSQGKVSEYLLRQLKPKTRDMIRSYKPGEPVGEALLGALVDDLNLIIQEGTVYDAERFSDGDLSAETAALLHQLHSGKSGRKETAKKKAEDEEAKVRLNRLLLVDAYPRMIDGIPESEPIPFPNYKRYRREKMIELVRKKAPIARRLHRHKRVGRKNLAKLFDDPEKLLSVLRMDGFIDEQNPRNSEFLRLTEFNGPMYKVFNEKEKTIILDWIESLREEPAARPTPRDRAERAAEAVRKWIADYADDGAGVPDHLSFEFQDEDGKRKRLNEWLSDPPGLMAAFRREEGWVKPGDGPNSRLYKEFSDGDMSWVPEEVADMIREWIDTDARVPGEKVPDAPPADRPMSGGAETAPVPAVPPEVSTAALRPGGAGFAERRMLIGMGSVH